MAPSTRMTSPFIIGFRMMDSTIIAYSSGLPSLCGKGTVLARKACTFSGRDSRRGVLNKPGAIVQTLIPCNHWRNVII